MAKKRGKSDDEWLDARRRCGLSDDEVRMAKALGIKPRTVIKNIPSKSQPWKAPVRLWIRALHVKRFGDARGPAAPKAGPSADAIAGNSRLEGQLPAGGHGAGTRKKASKPVPLGTDPALVLPGSGGQSLTVAYWDLWFSLIATKEHGGDLARLSDHLGDSTRAKFFGRESVPRKRAHIRDLKHRLTTAGQAVEQIVAGAGEMARTELRRARRRILEPTEKEREWSQAMQQDPKERRYAQALRGFWPHFPVSPAPSATEIASQFRTRGYYTEEQSFGIVRKLDRYLDHADQFLAAGTPRPKRF